MIFLPTEIRGNIAMIGGAPWGFGRFIPFSYDALSMKEKSFYHDRATQFFRQAVQSGNSGIIWMTRREQNWEKELADVVKNAPESMKEKLKALSEAWLDTIADEGAGSQYEFLCALELEDSEKKLGNLLKSFFNRSPRLDDKLMRSSRLAFNRQTASYEIEPLTEAAVAEIYRNHNYLGLPMPKMNDALTKLFAWEQKDKTFLMPNPIEDCGRYLRIDSDRGSRYVSFVTIALFPLQITAPGFDLFYEIAQLGLPVDAMISWHQKGYREAKNFATRKKKTAKANLKHISEVEDPSFHESESDLTGEEMEAEIMETKSPLNMVRMVFRASAEDPETLDEVCESLIEHLDGKGVTAHRFAADQAEYYDAWLPAPYWTPMGYKHPLLPDRTAALVMPGALDALGDPVGLPRGVLTSNGSIVRVHLPWGVQTDQSSLTVVDGQPGSGKTHLALEIASDTVMTTPSRGIFINPKGDHANLTDHPVFGDQVQQIFLNGQDNPGALDPFMLIENPHAAKEVALDMIEQALGSQSIDMQNDILGACERVIERGNPSMAKVIEEMEQGREKAQEAAQMLKRVKKLPLGRLIFDEGTTIKFPETGLIDLQIRNLRLPDKGQEAKRFSQRISEAIMTGISVLVERFLMEGKDKGVFSFFIGDEIWVYMRSSTGEQQLDRIGRMGRSFNCGAIYITQNPSDLPGYIRNQASTYICLGTKDKEETKIAMEALGVDGDNETVRQTLLRLGIEQSDKAKDGKAEERKFSRGYMRDLSKRVGLVKFITPQQDMRQFLKTRPELEKKEEVIM